MNKHTAPIGSTVHMISIDISDGTGRYSANNFFTKESSKVLLNNGEKIVLDNRSYSSISIVEGYGAQVGKPILHIRINDPDYGNSLSFLLFTEEELTKTQLKEIISKGIKEKLGSMVNYNELYMMQAIESEQNVL